ncbi:MAG: hypothetical protein WC716_09900 [Chitinophagaceae bacterium]
MYKFRTLLFFLFLMNGVQNNALAQSDSVLMKGTITVGKTDTYTYKIVATETNGSWIGYSLLDESGPNETKTSVTLQFSKEKSGLTFSEQKFISSKSTEKNFCFIGGALKMNVKTNSVKGFFLGKDGNGKFCGNGSIKLNINETAKKLLTPDGTKDTNANAIITSFRSESIKVTAEKIQIELWDGGINDHDSISVSLNKNVLLPALEILNEKRTLDISLQKGENIFKIKALNEGNKAPNSVQIRILDKDKQYKVISFLKSNEESTIKIKL